MTFSTQRRKDAKTLKRRAVPCALASWRLGVEKWTAPDWPNGEGLREGFGLATTAWRTGRNRLELGCTDSEGFRSASFSTQRRKDAKTLKRRAVPCVLASWRLGVEKWTALDWRNGEGRREGFGLATTAWRTGRNRPELGCTRPEGFRSASFSTQRRKDAKTLRRLVAYSPWRPGVEKKIGAPIRRSVGF